VQFDSVDVVNLGGSDWWRLAVSNVGRGTAYHVEVFWHFTGEDSARVSITQPPDLVNGREGIAPTLRLGNVAWLAPSVPDSIRWSDSP